MVQAAMTKLINSYLAFFFFLFAFSYENCTAIRCSVDIVHASIKRNLQCILSSYISNKQLFYRPIISAVKASLYIFTSQVNVFFASGVSVYQLFME